MELRFDAVLLHIASSGLGCSNPGRKGMVAWNGGCVILVRALPHQSQGATNGLERASPHHVQSPVQ